MMTDDGDENLKDVSQIKQRRTSRKSIVSRKSVTIPPPLKLADFLLWACTSMNVSANITIKKIYQDMKSPKKQKTQKISTEGRSGASTKSGNSNLSLHSSPSPAVVTATNDSSPKIKGSKIELAELVIIAEYDKKENLLAIIIDKTPKLIPKELIDILGSCIKYHMLFSKLTIRRGGLDHERVYRVGKLLACTHITELCLDDSYIPELNYYCLLDRKSNLKYLSLCRCKINDAACIELAKRLHFGAPASENLAILDLTSNDITDEGACYIGCMLRSNRGLVHLNLSGNQITDDGALGILDALTEFLLTCEELHVAKRKRFEYLKQKYEPANINPDACSAEPNPRRIIEDKRAGSKITDFHHPFDTFGTVTKEELSYCIGNLHLFSLNLGYNNLELPSLTKLVQVLRYQSDFQSGLARVILNGNRLPRTCYELDLIQKMLRKKA